MPGTKDELISSIRELFSSLSPEVNSARLASTAYNIMDLLIQMNTIDPGCCRKEILDLSRTIDKELSYAHEIAKDIYLKHVAFVTEDELIAAKKTAIKRIAADLSSYL